jgi:uncharacterized membrane protein (DUF4010 family)
MYPMDTIEVFQRLTIALAIGLLIGLERGWQAREEAEGERAAGLRTHALSALLGAVWGAIALPLGAGGLTALGLAFAAFGGAITLFRYRETAHEATYGATTVVAAMLAFALGAFAVLGDKEAAAAAGVAATGLLALKGVLHAFVQRVTWAELRSGLVLLVMTFVLLPLLPRRAIDPFGAVNPFEIWLMTIMIAVISFVGYVAVRLVGERRGVVAAGLAGGLASSTAVTLAMGRLAREQPSRVALTAAGALLADAALSPRLLAVLAFIDARFAWRLAPALGAAALVFAAGGAWLFWWASERFAGESRLEIRNPLDLADVLKFGALLSLIMVLSKIATSAAGSAGAYWLAALSGLADVDAISLSMVRLGRFEIGPEAAARAVLLAVAVNTASKAALGWIAGGAAMGLRLALVSGLALAAGWAAFLLVPA